MGRDTFLAIDTFLVSCRLAFTCTKLKIETPEQCMKPVQSQQYKDTGTTSLTSPCLYC